MRRALVAVYVHLVWATWDRLPMLDEAVEGAVWRAVQAKARDLGAQPLTVGGIEDHVHLLAQLPATLTVADLVGGVKGASAHLVTHELRPGAFFRWQGSYAAFSIGTRQIAQAKDYIARQREHHTANGRAIQWEYKLFSDLRVDPAINDGTQPA